MGIRQLFNKLGNAVLPRRKAESVVPPLLSDARRFPYGPFSFKATLPQGSAYTILGSTDLKIWNSIANGRATEARIEYLDSDASKFNARFYRVVANDSASQNAIGFVAITLAPGFSLIGNPLDSANNTVAELFKDWPDGTSLNKFDTRLFKLSENNLQRGRWTQSHEKLAPGDGAIFYNPTSDYKSHNFVGEVLQGNLAMPIPAGFSLRSSLVPRAGNLHEDLGFPIADGDVIHLFDRDRQKYVLHPFEEGKWKNGPPIVSVGESFWVAKTDPGNWKRDVFLG
jgi:hypothetical protein